MGLFCSYIYVLLARVLTRIDPIISIQLKALQYTHKKIKKSVGSVLLTSYDHKHSCGATYKGRENVVGGFKPRIHGVCENDLNGTKCKQFLTFDSINYDMFVGLKDTPIV